MDTRFFDHPFIQKITGYPHWTVSDKDKRPVHIGNILANRYQGEGAYDGNPPYTASLTEIRQRLGIPNNAAFYLDSVETGFMVLDIEPTCPDDVKKDLLATDWIYGEFSLSGKGYHLVYPVPSYLVDYPIAYKKPVIKCRKDYEFHMLHWVTFTGNMLPITPSARSIDDFFRPLCEAQVETIKGDVDVTDADPGDFPMKDVLLNLLMSADPAKTPSDYDNDMSKYEFGVAAFYGSKLMALLDCQAIKATGHTYTDQECVWLVYTVMVEKLKYRPKHDELRDGLPWLLYEASCSWGSLRAKLNKAD